MSVDLDDLPDLDDLGDLDDLEDIDLNMMPAQRTYDAYPRTEELEVM
jgi:hypothetical protein